MAKEISGKVKRLRAARLAVIQALYDMTLSNHSVTRVMGDFASRGGTAELEDKELAADSDFFHDLLKGVVGKRADIDPVLNDVMENRQVARLEIIMRGILRCGAYEIIYRDDIDAPVTISEYVTIATSFFEGSEPSFVNGVLDKVAQSAKNIDEPASEENVDEDFDPLA